MIIYRQYRIQNKANTVLSVQKEAIDQQKKEIELQRDNIKESNIVLEDKNRQITDSIEYAKRIQFSLLPDSKQLKALFPSSFIIHLPRDIVSGDFYFIHQNGESKYIAVADCTGHGVPGAFMTVLAHNLLQQIMNQESHLSPDQIIDQLDLKINENLHQHGISMSPMDGLDMGLLKINRNENTIHFAGAKIPAYHFNQKDIIQVEPDRNSIGGVGPAGKSFTCKSVTFNPGDVLYMATDGYQDQFGGHRGRKFMKMHFRNLLQEVSKQPFSQQEEKLVSIFNDWIRFKRTM